MPDQHVERISQGHTLEDIQADPSKPVNIGMVDLRQESNLRRGHGVIFRQEQLKVKDSTWLTISGHPELYVTL